jgi:flavin-dependent dehydrogenase
MASVNEVLAQSLTIRGINREYPQYGRDFLSALILDRGEVPYRRHGRCVVVLRRDWERWLERQAARTQASAVVEARLAREAERHRSTGP